MIYLFLLVGGGAGAYLASRIAPAIAAAAILTPLVLAGSWFGQRTGIDPLLLSSWKWLAGTGEGDIAVDCAQYGNGWTGLIGVLISIAFVVVFAACGLGSIVGIPAALIGLLVGGGHALITRSSAWLQGALQLFTLVAAAIVITGLAARGMHWSTGLMCEP